jgi:hypothetical protein
MQSPAPTVTMRDMLEPWSEMDGLDEGQPTGIAGLLGFFWWLITGRLA